MTAGKSFRIVNTPTRIHQIFDEKTNLRISARSVRNIESRTEQTEEQRLVYSASLIALCET
jgi:hypothetical protein